MKIEAYLRKRHNEKKMPQDCEVILNDLQVMREMLNDFYSYIYEHCCRTKVISDLYLSLDEQIDTIITDVKGE